MVDRVCSICGSSFQVRPQAVRALFCSLVCKREGKNRSLREFRSKAILTHCEICGTRLDSRNQRRFCSALCRTAKSRRGREIVEVSCVNCGVPFTRYVTELRRAGNGPFCSHRCSRVHSGEQAVAPNVSDRFGNWFSGLVDGEGSFNIEIQLNPLRTSIRFHIGLRDDDAAILETVKQVLGFGKVYYQTGKSESRNNNPKATYMITSLSAAIALSTVLDKYPLQTKKLRDYKIWREALNERIRGINVSYERIVELQHLLKSTRAYKPRDTT